MPIIPFVDRLTLTVITANGIRQTIVERVYRDSRPPVGVAQVIYGIEIIATVKSVLRNSRNAVGNHYACQSRAIFESKYLDFRDLVRNLYVFQTATAPEQRMRVIVTTKRAYCFTVLL